MGALKKNTAMKSLSGRVMAAMAQSLFTRKETLLNRLLKAVVRLGVGLFHRLTGYMKDDIIEADIGFTAEELNRYQYGDSEHAQFKDLRGKLHLLDRHGT